MGQKNLPLRQITQFDRRICGKKEGIQEKNQLRRHSATLRKKSRQKRQKKESFLLNPPPPLHLREKSGFPFREEEGRGGLES